MQTFKTLPDAIALAIFAHRNQQDKAGLPYIEHPLRVLETVKAMGGQPFVQMAAVLHDVTEDTAFTPRMLTDLGFSEAVVNLVKLLDRNLSEQMWRGVAFEQSLPFTKEEADDYYYANINADPNARMIKIADIRDNTAPWRLSYLSDETQTRLTAKYAKALGALGV